MKRGKGRHFRGKRAWLLVELPSLTMYCPVLHAVLVLQLPAAELPSGHVAKYVFPLHLEPHDAH